jgi:hypothetical protein
MELADEAANVSVTTAHAAALPVAGRALAKARPSLKELLRNDAAQDEFCDDMVALVWLRAAQLSAALEARLPAFMQTDTAAHASDDEGDDDEGDEHGHGGGGGAPRVKSDASIVTPQTMAVAAASSLSPKFSKLMVTGWPENERDCAELVKFLHDVEHEVVAKRLSLEARRSVSNAGERAGSYTGGGEALPVIGEEGDVEIGYGGGAGGAMPLRQGMHRAPSEENLESVTTVGPMLSQMLGAALQQQREQQ